jgi:hypothetical protein
MAQTSILPHGDDYQADLNDAYAMLQNTDDPKAQLKAQMIIDKVNEEITMQSNFEKAHHELMQAVTNNIGH